MKNILLLFIVLQLILTSCTDDEVNYEGISSNLLLDIRETHPNREISEPTLTFFVETEEQYPCYNYQIIAQTSLKNGILNIDILGTNIGDLCLTAFGPAILTFELDESVDRITIANNGKKDTYLISIDESSVEINSSNSTFSSFEYPSYFRFPENSFAFVCGTLIEDSNVCDDFELFLKGNLTLEEFEFPSNGKIPYPQSSDGYWFNAPAKYFKYQDSTDLTKAGELLNSFYTSELADKEGLGLSIIGWNNTYYRNNQQFN